MNTMVHEYPDQFDRLHSLLFTPRELRQVLSAYGEGVLRKGWKDYAITSLKGHSIFSVVDHMAVEGTNALYSFSKESSQQKNGVPYYRICHRDRQIFRSESFLETLEAFRALDQKGAKPGQIIRSID